ncbi:hypothetical protein COCON_G00139900 [Conger conger]|uniref:Uncharacterized protein n=1 Tax=Conger conger TaxID=82655 RepID=A0A9Q1HVL6_CONCO|nr:hypothetical protein COCON_G00139900 [Conger conger]
MLAAMTTDASLTLRNDGPLSQDDTYRDWCSQGPAGPRIARLSFVEAEFGPDTKIDDVAVLRITDALLRFVEHILRVSLFKFQSHSVLLVFLQDDVLTWSLSVPSDRIRSALCVC